MLSSVYIIFVVTLPYYKLLFDQICDKIKLIFDGNSVVINKKKETQLIWLINEHDLAGIEISKMNLFMNGSTAALFLDFSISKIISLVFSILYSI